MKALYFFLLGLTSLFLNGCATSYPNSTMTNPAHVGPAVGHAVGRGAGVVAGNVAAGAVATVEGVATGTAEAFTTPDQRIIRRWETVQTTDGRKIAQYREYIVDEQGNIIREIKRGN